ncbi:uncharacterized protein TRUGW13939_04685 [Talaromyces rugulosus]|uniref:Uncharacterized protein n=1 Tax=Talaromyces rugulosus TaxID=121627 RepID=A0A7H8QUC3_TALRU|nr:uncharacterized protein TRUGW13939_04685 [Talaromyces rugulosus]QKX57567.1 hypothetical protein TRUGW13939_04685 [Talaromyces rugulosus]
MAGILISALALAPLSQAISIPSLPPKIQGVTTPLIQPLYDLLPALPILQAPLPPLDSPAFTPSNIKPKKVGYYWVGAGDKEHADFLATYSLDDDTFGTLIYVTDVPTSGNDPHHIGVSSDGQTIVGGGLLSLLKLQDTAYYFDVSNPYRPAFKKSNSALLSSIADEIRPKPDGGFFITYMGSALGTSPGRLVETDADFNIIHEWPEDVEGTLGILAEQFSPHGISIDWDRNYILTSDFVVPLSILKPSTGVIRAQTLRLWNLESRTIISTITIPGGSGIQDVKFIPGNPEGAAIAATVGSAQLWVIYPGRKDSNGNQGVAELIYDFGDTIRATNPIASYSDITQDGKYIYVTLTSANHVAALDISDLTNPKRLDDPDEVHPIVGPHYIKVTPDQKHIVVTDYFVQTGEIGIVNVPADFKAQYIDINDDGSISFNRSINFSQEFENRGGGKPHSALVFDFTDPEHPLYY